MEVEHITAGGGTTIRSTDSIHARTSQLFKGYGLHMGKQLVQTPYAAYDVIIELKVEGALFDIVVGEVAYHNVCCFGLYDQKETDHLFELVQSYYDTVKLAAGLQKPTRPSWLYSIPINRFILSPEEQETMGYVSFYIYDGIRNAWKTILNR